MGRGFLTLLIIREIQIKTTVRFHLTHIRMATIKKTIIIEKITSVGENEEKLELL
jgi:predicted MarR family transcription regulator